MMRIMSLFIAVIFAAGLLFCAGGCSAKSHTADPGALSAGTMLVNYFAKDLYTDGGVFELVLKITDDPEVLCLDCYTKASADDEEHHTRYLVPAEAAEAAYQPILEGKMYKWGDDGISIDGVIKVCKFYYRGEFFRVSTESMPSESHERFIDAVGNALMPYMTEENRKEEDYDHNF